MYLTEIASERTANACSVIKHVLRAFSYFAIHMTHRKNVKTVSKFSHTSVYCFYCQYPLIIHITLTFLLASFMFSFVYQQTKAEVYWLHHYVFKSIEQINAIKLW